MGKPKCLTSDNIHQLLNHSKAANQPIDVKTRRSILGSVCLIKRAEKYMIESFMISEKELNVQLEGLSLKDKKLVSSSQT